MPNTKQTALFTLHSELKAKFTCFAGYTMPVYYPLGIIKEHQHTRTQAGLFDISHMGQLRLTGPHCAAELEKLVPSKLQNLQPGQQRYTVMTNESGGIIDDLIIANLGSHFLLIVNAAQKATDLQHLQKHLSPQCDIQLLPEQSLLALQGPYAIAVLEQYEPALRDMPYMSIRQIQLNNIPCTISRSGYTGEDGFEISVDNNHAMTLAQTLLAHPEVQAIGLGARDSLRLEAGLCLYGHELNTEITTVEANLTWLIAKNRTNFLGATTTLKQQQHGAKHYRVGIKTDGKSILREGSELHDSNGNKVGYISSGSFGASILRPVAMAYVTPEFRSPGSILYSIQRHKKLSLTVTSLPFVEHHYYQP